MKTLLGGAQGQENFKTEAECHTMCTVYSEKLDKNEKARIEKLEIFDEFEEWNML